MRISDWSSDVCSSDLRLSPDDLATLRNHIDTVNREKGVLVLRFMGEGKYFCSGYDISSLAAEDAPSSTFFGETIDIIENARPVTIAAIHGGAYGGGTDLSLACDFRSEEHTSELKSLMSISYAVFCLKKTKH